MNHQERVRPRLLARNVLLTLIGHALPLLLGLLTLPFVVRGLGGDRFGILAFAWILFGTAQIFDLGLSRGVTKFVAEALIAGDDRRIVSITTTAVAVQLLLGAVGFAVLAALASPLVGRVLNVPVAMIPEAATSFRVMALAIPAVMVFSTFRGLLEAAQRFDILNAANIPLNSSNYLLPFAGVLLGWSLPGIIGSLVAARGVGIVAALALCLRALPALRRRPRFDRAELPVLLRFGGWSAGTRVLIPIFTHLDRFLIGSMLSLGAVTLYTVPYEAVSRLLVIPSAVATVLFPAFSSLSSQGAREEVARNLGRALKYIVILLFPVVVGIFLLAPEILRLWMGEAFARDSATVMRIISVAILLNGLAYVPFVLIEAVGRPDLLTKYHLLELPVYVAFLYLATRYQGLHGAAAAVCIRMVWTLPVLMVLAIRSGGLRASSIADAGAYRGLLIAGLGFAAAAASPLYSSAGEAAKIAVLAMILTGFTVAIWRYCLDPREREQAAGSWQRIRAFVG